MSGFITSPKVNTVVPIITDWVSWTPTGSWTSNTTYTGKWRRVGDKAEYRVLVTTSGAPTSVALTINLPSGHILDTAKLTSSTNTAILGFGHILDTGIAYYDANVYFSVGSTGLVSVGIENASGTYLNSISPVNATTPMTWTSGDHVEVNFSIPISNWASNGVVNTMQAASATENGFLTTSTQTFTGDKTFSGSITANSTASIAGLLTASAGVKTDGAFTIGVSYDFGDYSNVYGTSSKPQNSMLVLVATWDVTGTAKSALYLINCRVYGGSGTTNATRLGGDAECSATFAYIADNILRVTNTSSAAGTAKWRYLGGF